MNKNQLFIEETTDLGYQVLWRGDDSYEALNQLSNLPTKNRIELWSVAHAESPKGFAPLGYRAKNSSKVSLSHTFTFLGLGLVNGNPPAGFNKIK